MGLAMLGLLSACGGKHGESEGEEVDEFGLPEVNFGKLAEELESAVAKSNEDKRMPDGDPDDIYTNVYVVPPTFLSSGQSGAVEEDPFADNGATRVKGRTAKDVLESYGVVFGPGTAVITGGGTSQLMVRQTADQMAIIEKILETLKRQVWSDNTINVRVEIYELPALQALEYQQNAESEVDHSAQWKEVMQLTKKGGARFVKSATILSRSGQRSKFSDVEEVIYVSDFEWQNPEKLKAISPLFQTREIGTILEVDPSFDGSGEKIELAFSFEYHSAPPTTKKVMLAIPGTDRSIEIKTPIFHAKKITSKFTLRNGAVRIIGAWRPTGKPDFEVRDLMHIAFLKVDAQAVYPTERVP